MLNDWYALGDCQYRKWHIYDMDWQNGATPMELENYLVCGSPFGGPVAMIPDTKRIASLPDYIDKKKLLIFTSAGKKLGEIDWTERPVIGMGWTDLEQLAVMSEDGLLILFFLRYSLLFIFNIWL